MWGYFILNSEYNLNLRNIKTLFHAVALIAYYTLATQVAVTTDGSSADGSAIFDVKSTDKGMLPLVCILLTLEFKIYSNHKIEFSLRKISVYIIIRTF